MAVLCSRQMLEVHRHMVSTFHEQLSKNQLLFRQVHVDPLANHKEDVHNTKVGNNSNIVQRVKKQNSVASMWRGKNVVQK